MANFLLNVELTGDAKVIGTRTTPSCQWRFDKGVSQAGRSSELGNRPIAFGSSAGTSSRQHRLRGWCVQTVKRSLAQSTRKSYKKYFGMFQQFVRKNIGSFKGLNEETWLLFVAHLATVHSYRPSTIASAISAVSYCFKVLGLENMDHSRGALIKMVLRAMNRATKSDNRKPITADLLEKLVQVPMSTSFERKLFSAMYSVMFFGLLRIGELCYTTADAKRNILQISDVRFSSGTITLRMENYKHSDGDSADIVLSRKPGSPICPVYNLCRYLRVRGAASGPLFIGLNGGPISRGQFASVLQEALHVADPAEHGRDVKPHSFRIGGACHAAECGYSDAQIRKLGRWKSNAFKKYLRAFAVK